MLLHGLAGQPEQWRWLETELQGRGHTTRALALPRGTWADHVAVVAGAVEEAGAGGAIVVGHSLGGLLVRVYAAAHPGAALGLATIAAPTADYVAPWFHEVGRVDDGDYVVDDRDRFLELVFPGGPPELRDLPWRAPLPAGRVPPDSPEGHEPRLAILCEGDEAVPYDDQQAAAKAWPAPVASVPGGHSPHVRHPSLVATLLLNWLTPQGA